MWIIFAVITVILWGTSETIFKSVSNKEPDSVLKLISYNGIILGVCATAFMLITQTEMNLNVILTYLPVSIIFITSMFLTYKAMKLVKISIISPLQNSSCAITCLLCVILLKQELSIIQIVSVVAIVVGIILLSINKSEINESDKIKSSKKYIAGILFALGYWLLDGIGSFLDDYTLDETLSAEQLIIAFSFIYCVIGIGSFVLLKIKNRKEKNKFEIKQISNLLDKKLIGTLIETAGQYTYIYTFAFGEAALASPFIAAYSIVSLILSRIFLKEKLNKKQYMLIALIIISLVILSIE